MTETRNTFSNARVIGKNVAPELYHQHALDRGNPAYVMSRSALMEFDRCPSRWLAGYESKDTDATDWGTLIDCLALDTERFHARVAVTPATYPADGKRKDDPPVEKPWTRQANYCKDWEAQHAGKLIIKPAEYQEARDAVKRLLDDAQINALLKCSQTQVLVTAEYQDAATNLVIPVKILVDALPKADSDYGKGLADLKTCTSAAPGPWTRAVFDRGYHVQAAMYLDVYNAATGEERTDFYHILQENYAPWQTGKRIVSSEFLELGRLKYRTALTRYAACLAAKRWPDFDSEALRQWNGWAFTEPEIWMVNK